MVTMTIPSELLSGWFIQTVGGVFDKLGLPAFFCFIHSSYLYAFGLLAVLAAAVAAVIVLGKKKKKPAASTKQMPSVEDQAPVTETEPEESGEINVLAAAHQHIGTRSDQQDSYGVSDPENYTQRGVMAVVADGMGGLSNGRAVSSALVRAFLVGFRDSDPQKNPADLLLEQAVVANAGVNQMLRDAERSGSTLVSCIVREGKLNFLTVGDSRIYLYRSGALIQLNREHTYQEELAVKAINHQTPLQQVRTDRQAHALTSFFGIGVMPYMDRNDEGIKLVDGDKILLASDGVFGTLSQSQMETALAQDVHTAMKWMGEWILKAGLPHQDNNTAVVLEYRA